MGSSEKDKYKIRTYLCRPFHIDRSPQQTWIAFLIRNSKAQFCVLKKYLNCKVPCSSQIIASELDDIHWCFSTISEYDWMFINIVQHTNWTTSSNPVFCRGYVNQYFDNKEEDVHKDTFRQIAIDVPRMSPLVGLFQQRLVQEMVERILYIWAIRSPHIILYDHWSIIHILQYISHQYWKEALNM